MDAGTAAHSVLELPGLAYLVHLAQPTSTIMISRWQLEISVDGVFSLWKSGNATEVGSFFPGDGL